MISRVRFGVIVAGLVSACVAVIVAADPQRIPFPCRCKISCYLVCAKQDAPKAMLLDAEGR